MTARTVPEIIDVLVNGAVFLTKEPLTGEDIEQAMVEVGLALAWMRQLPGGLEARERMVARLEAELKRRGIER